jgi:protein phosphatase
METEVALTDGARIELDTAGLTDVGRMRERNEDQFLIASVQRTLFVKTTSLHLDALQWLPNSQTGTVLLVADGMGGVGGGDVASTVAVRAIADYLTLVVPLASGGPLSQRPGSERVTVPGVRQGLRSALKRGDSEVKRAAEKAGADAMGTTLTLAYVLWPYVYIAHVGDSRCYLHRDGTVTQLTTDHTFAQKLREQSSVVVDESSPWHHVLWNALGGDGSNTAEPDIQRVTLVAGDALVLCSDGLTKHVSESAIAKALDGAASASEACAELVGQANADGGTDNITVVIARCRTTSVVRDPSVDTEAPTVRKGA